NWHGAVVRGAVADHRRQGEISARGSRTMSSGVELIFVLCVFLALLCVGMTIPFAILVPSVLYLLTHAGLAAYAFSYAISYAGVGEQLTQFLVGLKLSRLEFFGALFVLYTVLGCLVESLGMIVVTVPLLYPVLLQYGVDPIWFGVILVLFIEMGQISPPIGINLFVIQSIWSGKLSDVVTGTIPFHLIMFVLLGLLVLFPDIAMWLPSRVAAGA